MTLTPTPPNEPDTPRTDAAEIGDGYGDYNVSADFARQLERELAAHQTVKADRDVIAKELSKLQRWDLAISGFAELVEAGEGDYVKFDDIIAHIEPLLAEKDREIEQLKQLDIDRGGTLGRIAIELFGDRNNITDAQCEIGVKSSIITARRYERAHNSFNSNILELLQRCQNGEATCIFTAQIIEEGTERLKVDLSRLTERNKELEEKLHEAREQVGSLRKQLAVQIKSAAHWHKETKKVQRTCGKSIERKEQLRLLCVDLEKELTEARQAKQGGRDNE